LVGAVSFESHTSWQQEVAGNKRKQHPGGVDSEERGESPGEINGHIVQTQIRHAILTNQIDKR